MIKPLTARSIDRPLDRTPTNGSPNRPIDCPTDGPTARPSVRLTARPIARWRARPKRLGTARVGLADGSLVHVLAGMPRYLPTQPNPAQPK